MFCSSFTSDWLVCRPFRDFSTTRVGCQNPANGGRFDSVLHGFLPFSLRLAKLGPIPKPITTQARACSRFNAQPPLSPGGIPVNRRGQLALYNGDTRVRTMDVYVDGTLVTTWTSSGTTAGFESIDLSGTSGSVIEIVGVLGNSEWLSIIEVSPSPPSEATMIPVRPCNLRACWVR